MQQSAERVLLLASVSESQVGGHLLEAATLLGINISTVEPKLAQSSFLWNKLYWYARDRMPPRIGSFEERVYEYAAEFKPTRIVCVGRIPIRRDLVRRLSADGGKPSIWLTDDPWNPAHCSQWLLDALPEYEHVFTPRESNYGQLVELCQEVHYLPFAYSPARHQAAPVAECDADCDVLFVGGADADRRPFIHALLEAGLQVRLFGGYWHRHAIMKGCAGGIVSLSELIRASQGAKITLVLARRANRDGHVMRSYESAVAGTCMLVEDTVEHRQMFGQGSQAAVAYFQDERSMVKQVRMLLSNPSLRDSLRQRAYQRIAVDGNTYADRLRTILAVDEVKR